MSAPLPNDLDRTHALPKPPSFFRVLRILAGVAFTRFGNCMTAMSAKKPNPNAAADKPAPREATAPKRAGRILGWIGTGFMFFSFLLMSVQFVERASHYVDPLSHGEPIVEESAIKESAEPKKDATAETKTTRYQNGRMWPNAGNDASMVSLLGLVGTMFSICLLIFASCGNQEVGKIDWDLEWLFTMPVSSRALLVARAVPLMLVGALGLSPLLLAAYCCSGYGMWGIFVAIGAAAYIGLLFGFLCLTIDIWMHKSLSPAVRKNLQAVSGIVAGVLMLLYVLVMATAGEWLLPYFVRTADAASWIFSWNPFGAPLTLAGRGMLPVAGSLAMVAFGIAIPVGCLELTNRMVRAGLTSETGAYQGTHAPAPTVGRWKFGTGIIGKELLLLWRDKNYLVQTLLMPVLLYAFNVAMMGNVWHNATTNAKHGAALSFGLGVYLLLMSSSRVLSAEGNTFWLLYTFPQQLHSMLLKKTRMWCGFAIAYALASMVLVGSFGLASDPAFWLEAITVVVGVAIFAFVFSGIGVLGTEPNENGVWRQRKELAYLNLLLVALFASAIYSPTIWGKVVQCVLSASLAVAIWQRVQDQLPYLLDPSETSSPRITLIDGLVAVLMFFTVQTIANRLLMLADLTMPEAMTIAFAIAGSVVVLVFVAWLRQKKVANLKQTLRLAIPQGEARKRVLPELALAAFVGIGLATVATAYLWVAMRFDPIRDEIHATPLYAVSSSSTDFWWLAVLFVVAAPLFEEFIFRGMIHTSLSDTYRPTTAMLMSATLFAIVHPPISVAPVFLLGLGTAWSLNRSAFLGAPAIMHLVYNAAIVAANRLLL
ncbi:MAG: CPBP family glutamic-type intramembrane protease [Gemmataceae bacterium]